MPAAFRISTVPSRSSTVNTNLAEAPGAGLLRSGIAFAAEDFGPASQRDKSSFVGMAIVRPNCCFHSKPSVETQIAN